MQGRVSSMLQPPSCQLTCFTNSIKHCNKTAFTEPGQDFLWGLIFCIFPFFQLIMYCPFFSTWYEPEGSKSNLSEWAVVVAEAAHNQSPNFFPFVCIQYTKL